MFHLTFLKETFVYGLDSHIGRYIEILGTKLLFFVIEKLEKDIFVILFFFFIDLFTIFELITILSVN